MAGSDNNKIIKNTVQDIFLGNDRILQQGMPKFAAGKGKITRAELELALTVLLVDLASCDQNFDQNEYQTIQNGLRRIFGTTREQVSALINQANNTLKNLRGTSRFATLLKDNLDQAQRETIFEVIEDVIGADGVEDGFETYLRHKFADLLGVKPKEKAA